MLLKADIVVADSLGTIFSPGAIRFRSGVRSSVPREPEKPGEILEVGRADELQIDSSEEIFDLKGRWILPGLVQAHLHLNQTIFRGLAERLELLPWLRTRIWPLEAAHEYETIYASARQSVVEMLSCGATSALTMETTRNTEAVFQACYELGFRASIGTALMDRDADNIPPSILRNGEGSLVESVELHNKWSDKTAGRLQSNIAPRFVLSCTEEVLQTSKEVASEKDLIWHTHVSENRGECEEIRNITGMDNAEYFDKLGLLDSKSSLAHGIWLTDNEKHVLADKKASILHCPSTNLKMGSGIAETVQMDGKGINVALGSDGAPANNRLDIFAEIRLAALLASFKAGTQNVDPASVFGWATIGGAKAMGQEDRIGSLTAGKLPDMISIDPGNFAGNPENSDDIYAHLVYGASSNDVRDVWIDGSRLVEDGSTVEFDRNEILENFKSNREALLGKITL